jgi:hypothetical protein
MFINDMQDFLFNCFSVLEIGFTGQILTMKNVLLYPR